MARFIREPYPVFRLIPPYKIRDIDRMDIAYERGDKTVRRQSDMDLVAVEQMIV